MSRRPPKCPTPWKRALTEAVARSEAKRLNGQLRYLAQHAYSCACGAWHIGNPRVRKHQRNMKRRRRGSYTPDGRSRR